MLKLCMAVKILMVVCSLVFVCFDYTTSAFPDFIQSNGLDINGSNVCQNPITKTINIKILRQREHKERYNTSCYSFIGWLRFRPCTKTRIRMQSFYQLTVQKLYGYSLDCCHQWGKMGQNETECLKPMCVHGCKHGKCVAANTCDCDRGWRGYTCSEDINECYIKNGGCQQECHNTEGSLRCTCRRGYIIDINDPTQCLDINECKMSPQPLCLCASKDSHCNATCVNTIGNFKCVCPKGYQLNRPNTCTDVDECLSSITNNCPHKCVNKPGSYECSCFKGFKYDKKNSICKDLNECADNNGGCDHRCLNFYGSYRCLCNLGYRMAPDRRKCLPFRSSR